MVFTFTQPLTFLYNTLIIFATMSLALLFKRAIAMWTTAFMIWTILGTANAVVLLNRPSPFTGSDFLILPSVLEIFTVYLEVWQLILIIVGLLAVIAGIVILWVKAPKREMNLKKQLIKFGSVALSLVLSTHICIMTGVVTTDYSNVLNGYYEAGFPYSFCRSIICRGIPEPDDYSKETVDSVLSYIEEKRTENEKTENDDTPNIIYVQLESFFDVSAIKDITLSENPIPYFTELKNTCQSGFLRIPLIGSGTANTEFEVLTGMSMDYFSPGEYPFIMVLKDNPCESAASILSGIGYKTHTMHNNTGTFYSRHKVYPNLGFDTFTPIEHMYDVEYNSLGWAKDKLLKEEIIKTLESTSEKDFVFTVAVQPHGAYPTEPTPDEKSVTVSISGSENDELINMYSYYVNQIKETDLLIKELTEFFSTYDEKTVIVFYGDHLPDLKLSESDLTRGDMYSTEYIIWSNYDMYDSISDAPDTLEAFQLTSYVFGLVGIDQGVMNGVHRYMSENENYRDIMSLMEYDALYGEKYCFKDNPPKASSMSFGVTPIAINNVSISGNLLKITGMGFNEYSVVYINGKRYDTVFESESSLKVQNVKIPENSTVTVAQEATDGTIFSETDKYLIK